MVFVTQAVPAWLEVNPQPRVCVFVCVCVCEQVDEWGCRPPTPPVVGPLRWRAAVPGVSWGVPLFRGVSRGMVDMGGQSFDIIFCLMTNSRQRGVHVPTETNQRVSDGAEMFI